MKYGINESRKLFCKKHQEFHPSNEGCRWCDWRSCMQDVPPVETSDPEADPDCYSCGGKGFYYAGIGVYRCSCVHGVGSP